MRIEAKCGTNQIETESRLGTMKGREIRPMLVTRRSLRGTALGGMFAVAAALPSAAQADCDVLDDGVPEDTLLSSLGPAWPSLGGLRPASVKNGIAVGGNYFGEAFLNSGGLKQVGEYDGVLEFYTDM